MMKHSNRQLTKKIGYIIASSQEAQPLLRSAVVLVCLAEILRRFGVVLQQWTLDDELVLTLAKRPIPKARLEKELNADDQHRPLKALRLL